MIQKARELTSKMTVEILPSKERKVIELLNTASTYPNMSKYQLAMARIILSVLYFSHKIYRRAYGHYKIALEDYPKAPVKRKLAELEEIKSSTPDEFIFLFDAYIVNTDICHQCSTLRKRIDDVYDDK